MHVIQQENQNLRLSSSQNQKLCNIIFLGCVLLEFTLQECLIFGLVLWQDQKPCNILIHGVGFFGLHQFLKILDLCYHKWTLTKILNCILLSLIPKIMPNFWTLHYHKSKNHVILKNLGYIILVFTPK